MFWLQKWQYCDVSHKSILIIHKYNIENNIGFCKKDTIVLNILQCVIEKSIFEKY